MKLFETRLEDEDIDVISKVLKSGDIGFGSNVNLFEKLFRNNSGKNYNIATNSASAASYMIFAYLREKYGVCDIYTPSIQFTSPVWAAKQHGHRIIWVDVDDNLLFDVENYKEKLFEHGDSNRKPVVMPILYGGVSTIPNIGNLNNKEIIVVDSAHCVTPTINADYLFFSFHPYKPIAASDGGMISTNDYDASEFFQAYRNFGRQNKNGTYDITMDGFKFYMNNLNATIALTQLGKYRQKLESRKQKHDNYTKQGFTGRLLPHDEYSSYYFSTLICEEYTLDTMTKEYPTSKHYPMLHKTEYYGRGLDPKLPNTERLHKLIVNLPLV